ncbi:MAG: formylmethanofuran--tetrahydromethanopterin N-formyltransferase [Halobacteriota archaeon]|nr:formylmethanofuran--tetrahydromethanopterin N-formyltransferase [Halobacteriota archaeon]
MGLGINGIEVDDTYCEAFDGLLARLLVTAKDEPRLLGAIRSATALPSTVFGEAEGGIEGFVDEGDTPDGRIGAIIQIWVNNRKDAVNTLEYEMSKRIRQGILVTPTTTIFNLIDSDDKIDIMDRVGHCGDGYETTEERFGKDMINIPLMMGEFLIERYLGYAKGIMGGNVWFFCKNMDVALEAGDSAVEAIGELEGAITSFDICSAGSKPETKYPEIGPTTNHIFCPTLKENISESKVPDGVSSIPEIVINATTTEVLKEAMKAAIYSVRNIDGVSRISAGNYGGNLGKHKIYLRDLL